MIGEIGNFKMKKLLLILLCLPMIGFGQLNTAINERIKNTKYTIVHLPKMLYEANFDYFIDELSNLGFNIIENTEGVNKCEILYIYVTVGKKGNWLNCGSLKIEFKDCDGNVVYYKNKIIVPSAPCLPPYKCCYSQYGQVLSRVYLNSALVSEAKEHQYKKISQKKENPTNYEALLQLANLKKEGILSEEEFDIEKRKILGLDDNTAKEEVKESSNISFLVDNNIPANSKVKNRYALVIGNEDYTSFQRTLSSEQNVDYAVNDAKVFKEYCLKTLGVKEDNMFFLTNATAGTMHQEIDLITKIINKVGRKAELIVYYAGHGYPDELTKVPYLIPVDVSASNLSTAIKLDDFYKDLSATGAKSITVFLDACFTGGGRESGLMASRGVKVKPKEGSLSGNLVVFSASSGNQSALPYHKEGHGMFTYFLLKKFQESKGNVTLGELSEYLDENVSIKSLRVNQKEQDPTVNTSQKVINDWRNWKF
tara:strand:- start:11 stop:1453 length:1443 start_codon:yes stop_codon:yes gene_type:complete